VLKRHRLVSLAHNDRNKIRRAMTCSAHLRDGTYRLRQASWRERVPLLRSTIWISRSIVKSTNLGDDALQTAARGRERVAQAPQVHHLPKERHALWQVDVGQQLRRRQRAPHKLDLRGAQETC